MKVGIYGGTFDPVHNEHIDIVRSIISTLGLDSVIVLPSANPPHKNTTTDYTHRIAMLRLALEGIEGVEVSDLESRLPAPNYTINTLKYLTSHTPHSYVYVIGEDSMADIYKWYHPEEIFALATICVCGRSNRSVDADDTIKRAIEDGANIIRLDYSGTHVSSSLIRGLVEVGGDISSLVPPQVADYIEREGLYHNYKEMVASVRERIGDKRYLHTIGVVETALVLNAQVGLSFDKVFRASLLHDIDKYHINCDVIPPDSVGSEVAHQFSGAYTAEHLYGVQDEDILNAIRYHTTARRGQSPLEKIVYLADMIEPSRDYPEVDKLRRLAYQDIEVAYREAVKDSYHFVLGKGDKVYPLTIQAMEE
ncbi:MAG: nicotinate (nicotinamide) nucleotide adenylyltransferase [Clostridia bacterium]|nr:nicotinate (nicotinamide) nucleotide adenylyltransferase [Clostridia bacterium]